MPRLPYLFGAVLVGSLLAASPASAVALSPTPNPLPGSMFQGADGDQDDSPPYLDWQALQAEGRVRHSPDPNAADDAFQGGSKEDKPGQWSSRPRKAASPRQGQHPRRLVVGEPAGVADLLYLAFTRENAEGTTFVTFELNRDHRLWDNGRRASHAAAPATCSSPTNPRATGSRCCSSVGSRRPLTRRRVARRPASSTPSRA